MVMRKENEFLERVVELSLVAVMKITFLPEMFSTRNLRLIDSLPRFKAGTESLALESSITVAEGCRRKVACFGLFHLDYCTR